LHLYYQAPPNGCHTTIGVGGTRRPGLGRGVDFLCDRWQCHLPGSSSASPYHWDREFNLLTIPDLMPLPVALIPVELPDEEDETVAAVAGAGSQKRPPAITNADHYAAAAIRNTLDRIRSASPGRQRQTLNDQSLQLGSLVAGLGIAPGPIEEELIRAGLAMQPQAGREPWTRYEVRKQVVGGFRDGLRKPYRPQIRGRR
jgi:hypothetical protein